jgi:hypothetical protein
LNFEIQQALEEQGSVPAKWMEEVLTPKLQRIAQHIARAAQV